MRTARRNSAEEICPQRNDAARQTELAGRAGLGAGRVQVIGLVVFGRGAPNGVADAAALVLDAVHEAASPDELGGEQAEAEKNGEPAGSGSDEHDHTGKKKRKTRDDFEDAADLFDSAEDHRACCGGGRVAERVGFEPTVGVNLHTLSKRAP
jgi:hypothetical protein